MHFFPFPTFFFVFSPALSLLYLHQPHLTPVGERSHGKVNPETLRGLLYQQLVEVLLRLICDVKEYTCIAYCLFFAQHVDIHRTACQMVRPRDTTHGLIDCLTPIPAIDDNRVFAKRTFCAFCHFSL